MLSCVSARRARPFADRRARRPPMSGMLGLGSSTAVTLRWSATAARRPGSRSMTARPSATWTSADARPGARRGLPPARRSCGQDPLLAVVPLPGNGAAHGLGPVESVMAVASFERSPERCVVLREVVGAWRGPGTPVLVTHVITVPPLVGIMPEQAETVVVRPRLGDQAVVVGTISTPGDLCWRLPLSSPGTHNIARYCKVHLVTPSPAHPARLGSVGTDARRPRRLH